MKLIDKVNEILRDDLQRDLNKGNRITIVAASFSIYAFRELSEELSGVEELDFIFNRELFTCSDDEDIKLYERSILWQRQKDLCLLCR